MIWNLVLSFHWLIVSIVNVNIVIAHIGATALAHIKMRSGDSLILMMQIWNWVSLVFCVKALKIFDEISIFLTPRISLRGFGLIVSELGLIYLCISLGSINIFPFFLVLDIFFINCIGLVWWTALLNDTIHLQVGRISEVEIAALHMPSLLIWYWAHLKRWLQWKSTFCGDACNVRKVASDGIFLFNLFH